MSTSPVNRQMYKDNYSVGKHAEDKGYILTFEHEATGHKVSFPAVLKSYSDRHDANLSEKIFVGKMDPVIQQSHTGRKISFEFEIANGSVEEARHNQQSVNLLIQMMYPKLNDQGGLALGSYIKIGGLNIFKESNTSSTTTCLVRSITYALDPSAGFITPGPGELYPILLSISIDADALIPTIVDESEAANAEQLQYKQPYPLEYPSYK